MHATCYFKVKAATLTNMGCSLKNQNKNVFSTGSFRWRGWTTNLRICVTMATSFSTAPKTNNGPVPCNDHYVPGQGPSSQSVSPSSNPKKARKADSIHFSPPANTWDPLVLFSSNSKLQEGCIQLPKENTQWHHIRSQHNTVDEDQNRLSTEETRHLGAGDREESGQGGAQWVNSLRRVNQLTSRDGSVEDLAAEEEAGFFLVPSSWNGMVALLWRSELM